MKNKILFVKTFPVAWVYTLVITLTLLIVNRIWQFTNTSLALSFLLGSVTSLMAMSFLYKQSKKILDEPNNYKVFKGSVTNYLFRFIFYALVLVIAGLSDRLEIIIVGFGLFTFKICLLITHYFFNEVMKDD